MPLYLDAGVEPVAGYKLARLLGRGGFGEVWEAVAPGNVHVALKFIRLDTAEAGLEQRALDVVRDIRHPHLLDVQFATRVDDCLVIAMPLCDASLMDRLRACQAAGRPGVPRDELLGCMEDLARAVDFLNEPHARAGGASREGVQHRDIKPHNIFLVGGSVRLADFGLAKVLASSSGSHTGSMTPHYVAPEVIEGRVSQRSDQYSLAITYVQLRTGGLPFEGESVHQIMYAHLHNPPDLSGLPEPERLVVGRALAKRPEDRWPSCRAFVTALAMSARPGNGRHAVASESAHIADAHAGLAETVTFPPVTQRSSSIPSTLRDEGNPSEVGAEKEAPPRGRRLFGPAVVAACFAVLVAAIGLFPTIRRPQPETASPPRSSEPLTNPPKATSPPEPEPEPANAPAEPMPSPPIATIPRPTLADAPPKPESEPTPSPAGPSPTPSAPAPPKAIINTIGMTLVLIPAGEFLMGSPDSDKDALEDEKPQHRVRITRPFYLGATEVTQGQYRTITGEAPGHFKGSDDLPVEQVSWNDAIAFCNKLSEIEGLRPFYASSDAGAPLGGDGYRLPTEAEWEYACRAGSTTRFSFGDDEARLGVHAWIGSNSGDKVHPVGRKRANPWGLFDMHGNAWEWCGDSYDKDYYGQSPVDDPPGPLQAARRVGRGGSCSSDPRLARSAYRRWFTPSFRFSRLGFRVIRGQSGR